MKYKTKPKPYSKKQRVTYYKRKRGCLKKCIEMSTICDQDVFMVMLDKKTKMLIELNSTPEFDLKAVTSLLKN